MKRPLAAVLLALFVLLAGAARAAVPAKAAPLAIELARYVLPEESWNRTMDGISRQSSQYMVKAVEQQGGAMPPEVLDMKELAAIFSYQEIIDLQASVLASTTPRRS